MLAKVDDNIVHNLFYEEKHIQTTIHYKGTLGHPEASLGIPFLRTGFILLELCRFAEDRSSFPQTTVSSVAIYPSVCARQDNL